VCYCCGLQANDPLSKNPWYFGKVDREVAVEKVMGLGQVNIKT